MPKEYSDKDKDEIRSRNKGIVALFIESDDAVLICSLVGNNWNKR